jgi:hypothetical protein
MMPTRRIVVCAMLALLTAAVAAAQPAPAASDKADALSEAARKGDVAAVKKLLDEGVDVNTKFRYNRMALSFAADRGHADVVRLLLERGADVNASDTFYNATALTWAVSPAMDRTPRHADVVRLLLQHGAQGKDDALRGAVSAPDAATVKAVLEVGGVSPGALSDALEMAGKAKRADIVALLEQAGAKPHVEVKLDAAQLARYLGTYKDGPQFPVNPVVTTADGRLIVTLGAQKLTLIARDQSTFGVAEQPGRTVTFRLEADRAVALTLGGGGNAIIFTRIEEK